MIQGGHLLPAKADYKKPQMVAQVTGSLPNHMGEPTEFPALAPPSCCRHLGAETAEERSVSQTSKDHLCKRLTLESKIQIRR